MDAEIAVERALPVFGATAPGDWAGLRHGIAAAGVPQPLADEVLAFMPIAFGRELMNGMGIEFSPDYATYTPQAGARVAGRLAEHPVYAAAAALATRMVQSQQAGDAFVAVAVCSSEFSAANEALNAGSNVSDLVAGPPVITLDDEADAPAAPAAPSAPAAPAPQAAPAPPPEKKRPWWRFGG